MSASARARNASVDIQLQEKLYRKKMAHTKNHIPVEGLVRNENLRKRF